MTAQGRTFSVKTVAALIAVAVFSLSALTVLSAYAPDLRKGDDGGPHGLSTSAVGYGGLVKLLQATGSRVLLSRGPLHPSSHEGLLILTPQPQHSAQAIDDIHYTGVTLVVLPKWVTGPMPKHPGWAQGLGILDPREAVGPLLEPRKPKPVLTRTRGAARPRLYDAEGEPIAELTGPIQALQTLSGGDWEPVVVDENGGAVLAMNRESNLYVLSDPDFLNTQGLKEPANAVAAIRLLELLREGDGPVIIDMTLPGFSRPRSVLRLMLEPPLLGATLALVAAAGLIAYQASVRFGPGRPEKRAIALGKLALADNTAGLVRLAKREHRMAGPYAVLVRAAVARAIGARRNLSEEELDAFLDRLGANLASHDRYSALAAEAGAAKSAGDLIRVARNLYRWRLEMTRGRQ
jgi:hypothetical protein